jgi:hypothetical protein
MRVLVCGGRDFLRGDIVDEELNLIDRNDPISAIIEGGARGADMYAASWANRHDVENIRFHADWNKYGKQAGILRNIKMLEEGNPDLVLGFPTRKSKGTWHMLQIAHAEGVKIKVIPVE